jgi:hypothetical protein
MSIPFSQKHYISAAIFCKLTLTKPLPCPCVAADFGKSQQMQKRVRPKKANSSFKTAGTKTARPLNYCIFMQLRNRAPYQIEE